MTRCIVAFFTLALSVATSSAAPVALKDLTTSVLQKHLKSYLMADEATARLTTIATFATLDSSNLIVTEYGLVWYYTAPIPLTPQQEILVREAVIALLTNGLGTFNGGLLSEADVKTVVATVRISAQATVAPTWWTSYVGYMYGPAYLSTYSGHGCFSGKCVYRGGPWPSQLLITAPYPASAFALPYLYYPVASAYPYSYYTAPYTFPVVPYTMPALRPVSYHFAPETAKKLASAHIDTILGEVQDAYRGRNYAAALELAMMALEKDLKNPLVWCWRSAVETQLGLCEAAQESALRSKACQMITGIENDKIANAIEIIQGKPRSVLSAVSPPKDERTALAITSKPLPPVARKQNIASK